MNSLSSLRPETLTVVQIGTNRACDDLTDLIRALGASFLRRLIMIEPLTVHNEAILNCYRDVVDKLIVNAVIIPSSADAELEAVEFWYHQNDGPHYELASTDRAHIAKHAGTRHELRAEQGYRMIKAQCLDICRFFRIMSLSHVDILFIDAEGLDSAIVQSIDFDGLSIDNIFFENLHLPEGRAASHAAVYACLKARGYRIVDRCLSNGWMSFATRLADDALVPSLVMA